MNQFVIVSLVLAVTGEFLASIGFPGLLAYTPELCAMVASVLLVVHVARQGLPEMPVAYVVVLVLLALHILFGALANHVQVGTVLVGSRNYLRAIPFFLLAIVAPPNVKELNRILFTIVILGIIQLPIAISQRMATMARQSVEFKYTTTGDWTYGTLMNSAMLSIFLISVSALVFAALLRKRMTIFLAIPLILILLVPTMINETKASLFLIPIAFFTVAIAHSSHNLRRNSLAAFLAVGLFTAAFIPTYDYFIKPRWGYGIVDFFTMEDRVENYLLKGAEVGTVAKVGRLDALKLPITTLRKDPVSLTMGLGLGSVTESVFGDKYSGAYFSRYGNLAGPSVSRLTWELGLLGVALVFGLLFMIHKDALRLRSRADSLGTLAHAWVAILPVFAIGMFYKEIMFSAGLSIFFWYLSGVITLRAAESKLAGRYTGRAYANSPVRQADA